MKKIIIAGVALFAFSVIFLNCGDDSSTTPAAASASVAASVAASASSGSTTGTTYNFPWATWNTNYALLLLSAPVSSSTTGFNATAAAVTFVDGLTYYSKSASNLRFRDATAGGTVEAVNAVNYNGGSFTSGSMPAVNGTADSTLITRYISIPVTAGANKTVTVTYKPVTSGTGSTAGLVGLIGGTSYKVYVTAPADTSTATGGVISTITLSTASVTDSSLLILFSREGAGGGGIDVQEIKIQ